MSRIISALAIVVTIAVVTNSQFIAFNWNTKKPNDTLPLQNRMITKGWSDGDDFYLCGLRVSNFTVMLLKGNYTFIVNQVPNIIGLTDCIKTDLWKVTPFFGNYTSPVFVSDFDYVDEYCGGPDRRTSGCQRYFDLFSQYHSTKSGWGRAPNVFFFERVGAYETTPDGFPVGTPAVSPTSPPTSGASTRSGLVTRVFDYFFGRR